jgi:hypothetical protein
VKVERPEHIPEFHWGHYNGNKLCVSYWEPHEPNFNELPIIGWDGPYPRMMNHHGKAFYRFTGSEDSEKGKEYKFESYEPPGSFEEQVKRYQEFKAKYSK